MVYFMANELIDVVNEKGEPTGETILKHDAHRHGVLHRTAHVWIFNNEGEILLQRRSRTKDTYPGLRDISAAGHIGAGENIVIGAKREVVEELGISFEESELDFLKIQKSHSNANPYFVNAEIQFVFLLRHSGPFHFTDGEVHSVEWHTADELLRILLHDDSNDILPSQEYVRFIIGEVRKRI